MLREIVIMIFQRNENQYKSHSAWHIVGIKYILSLNYFWILCGYECILFKKCLEYRILWQKSLFSNWNLNYINTITFDLNRPFKLFCFLYFSLFVWFSQELFYWQSSSQFVSILLYSICSLIQKVLKFKYGGFQD